MLSITPNHLCCKILCNISVEYSLYFWIELIYKFARDFYYIGFFFGLDGSNSFSIKKSNFSKYLDIINLGNFYISFIDSKTSLKENIEKIASSRIFFYKYHSFWDFTDFLETLEHYFSRQSFEGIRSLHEFSENFIKVDIYRFHLRKCIEIRDFLFVVF